MVEPVDQESTRVILRSCTARGPGALYYLLAIEISRFIMERRMLKGIKQRAERESQRADRRPVPAWQG